MNTAFAATVCVLLATVATGLGAVPAAVPLPPVRNDFADGRLSQRPNIVVILADDMGFSDIASYGGEIPTPNLDRLAANGLRFTQFYNTARCSPSRAALMTGLYPHEAGMGNLDSVVRPQSQGLRGMLLDRAVTMAQVLGDSGYYTGMTGKWHLGSEHGSPPWQRGFQHSLELRGGTYFKTQKGHSWAYLDGRRTSTSDPAVGEGDWYASDLLVQWQGKFIREASAQKKPFFLYLPFTASHFPLMAPPADIARFKGKFRSGWTALRQARYERQKRLGIISASEPLPAALPQAYDWNTLTPDQQGRFDTMMAVYAAAISRMDKAIGDLVEALRAQGKLDNTLILFMADNGGNAEGGPNGRTLGNPLGSVDSTVFTGLNWATLQNTPFQYFKHYTEEGGIATPLIAHWPKGIDRNLNGGFVREVSHLIDVMPTVLQLGRAPYPKSNSGTAILPMEGRSLAPAFHGKKLTRAVPIFWEHEGNRAVRDGQWKLVARFGEPWELYDMSSDRSETRNVAAYNAQVVSRMSAAYDVWTKRAFVDAWPRKVFGGVVNAQPGTIDQKGPGRGGSRRRRREASGAGTAVLDDGE